MRNIPKFRGAAWIVLFGFWAGASGCTHNCYYGGVPACSPAGQAVTTQIGPVCEVPSGPATIVSSVPTNPGFVVQTNPSNSLGSIGPNPQKVVISQPAYGSPLVRNSGRFSKWHRPDPEGIASIRTEGGLSDDPIQR